MKKLNAREIIILVITLLLAAVFGVYQFIIKPVGEGAMDVNDRLSSVQHELAKARAMVAQKTVVDERYHYLADMIGTAQSDDAQMPAIIDKIESTARESNIHLGNIQPQRSITQKEAMFVTVELELDGQWPDIVQFLYALQQQPNFYFINEMNLEKYSDTASSLRGRVVISRMFLLNP